MTSLTLAMIVRDEAQMAPAFLESVNGLWEELIVVDTGSLDRTAELFERAGATVVHHPWSCDFAEARNVSLANAHSEWVLVLDADERVTPKFITAFRRCIEDPAVGALTIRISTPLPYGHRRESRVLRAFRRTRGDIRFRHAIHEDASADVMAMLVDTRTALSTIDEPVEHLGSVRSRAAETDKKTRDLRMLRACIEGHADDFYSHLKLLELARHWQDGPFWRDSALTALDALERAGRRVLSPSPWAGELIALIAEGLFTVEGEASLVFLDSWEQLVPASAAFFHRRGQCHEARGNTDAAQRDFTKCLTLGHALADRQLTTVRPLLGLSRLALMRGDFTLALERALQAVMVVPRDPEALLAVAAYTLHIKGAPGIEPWVAEHKALVGDCPERDWAIGEAAFAVGEMKLALSSLRRAAGVPPAGAAGVRLAQACLAHGDFELAERLSRNLMATRPEAGLGVLLFDLMNGRDTAIDLEVTPETAQAAMRTWVDALLVSQNTRWVLKFKSNLSAIDGLFPWLPQYLRRSG